MLDSVILLARNAGAAAMAHYDSPGSVDLKADHSPVTAADLASHRVILEGLDTICPGVPVISEEGEIPQFEVRRGWKSFWLVDPLDGTKEFLHRNGEFTVNISLLQDNVPVLGVVFAPAIGVAYSAGAGLGSWKQTGNGPPVRLLGPSRPGLEGAIVVESRSHPSPELEAWLRTIPVARRVQAGSSLKFGVVAEGSAHVYPRFGPTHDWDVAAGDCVWRNAILEGQRPSTLTYNSPGLKNPGFVIGVTG